MIFLTELNECFVLSNAVMPTSQNPWEIPHQNPQPGGSNPATAGCGAGAATGAAAATGSSGSGAGRRSVVPTAPKGSGSEVGSLVQLTG